jgi:outer membrane lipoprotein carrier protein
MLRSRPFIILMAFILAPLSAQASSGSAAATAKDLVATLEQGYATITDLQADFVQRTTIASLNREERGTGELFIKKSAGTAMFRFNYSKPRQQFISNGKTVWYYLPESRQVMVSDLAALFSGGNGVALNYLTGLGHISADFTARLANKERDSKGNYLLDLVPKKPTPVMARLRLTIASRAVADYLETKTARNPFPVVSSVVYDQLGNATRIDFIKVKINRGIGSDLFTFKPPAGVEIIKNQ